MVLEAACGSPPRSEGTEGAAPHTLPRPAAAVLPPSDVTQVVLLGTGTPNAEPDRYGSSVAVVVNGEPYLVDAGAGVVHRANEAFLNGVDGLAPNTLSTLFLTHLHSDHTVGLPDLILSPWVLGRENPLKVLGPGGPQEVLDHLSKAFERDVDIRINGLEPANTSGYRVESQDVEPGPVYQDQNVRVTAFLVPHGDWPQAFGYRIETPDRTIVVSGDTSPTESVVENCRGCDILIHEVYSQAGWEGRTPEWQRYHRAFHTSAPDLGELASRANPKVLILTHELLWGTTPEELVAEVQSTFSGFVVYGQDLQVF